MKKSVLLLAFASPPSSGKTYFSTHFVKNNDFTRINSDTIREEMFTSPNYSQDERRQVYEEMNHRIEESLKQKQSVILDGNLLTNNDRRRVFDRFKKHGEVIFLVLAIDLAYTLQRAIEVGNPLDAYYEENIRAMYQTFEPLDPGLPSITIKPGAYEDMERQLEQVLKNQGISLAASQR